MPLNPSTTTHVHSCVCVCVSCFLFLVLSCFTFLLFFFLLSLFSSVIMAKHIIKRAKREAYAICRATNNGAHLSMGRCVWGGFREVEGTAWCTGMKCGERGDGKNRGPAEKEERNNAFNLFCFFFFFFSSSSSSSLTAADAVRAPSSIPLVESGCQHDALRFVRETPNTDAGQLVLSLQRSAALSSERVACAWLVSLAFACHYRRKPPIIRASWMLHFLHD